MASGDCLTICGRVCALLTVNLADAILPARMSVFRARFVASIGLCCADLILLPPALDVTLPPRLDQHMGSLRIVWTFAT